MALLMLMSRGGLGHEAFALNKPRGMLRDKYDTFGVAPVQPKPTEGEAVPGLRLWLRGLGLEGRLEEANAWCGDMGAAVLVEVVDNVEDLAEALGLGPEDAAGFDERARKEFQALDGQGAIAPQPAVRPAEDLEGRTLGAGRRAPAGRGAGRG